MTTTEEKIAENKEDLREILLGLKKEMEAMRDIVKEVKEKKNKHD
jgi:hypothetical protein